METAPDTPVGLTPEEIADIRREADADSFFFARVICGHRELTEDLHMPLMYVDIDQIDKLVGVLENPRMAGYYTVQQIKRELNRHEVFGPWNRPEVKQRMRELFTLVNARVSRGFGKSTSLTHGKRLWKMVRDPNLTSALITNADDPKAHDFCKQIRATILSPLFGAVYPDRVPGDLKMLTESRLTLAGRTIPDMEPCFMAFGHKTAPTGYHFDDLDFDDLVARENRSPLELAAVVDFLTNVSGLYKPGIRRPICRNHRGTRWDEEDDDAEVRKIKRCFTINVPIWIRDEPTEDIRVPGRPTAPMWKDLPAILLLQEEVLSNPDEGALAWRCNYELDPAIAGGRIFSAALVDASAWTSCTDPKIIGKPRPQGSRLNPKQPPDRMIRTEWPSRVKRNEKNEKMTKLDAQGVDRFEMIAFDPDKLYIVTTCDQSFTEDGDEWCVGTIGMDQYGFRFVLEMSTGNGAEAMLDKVEMHRLTWRPRKIGFEEIAAQHIIELVIKLGSKYRSLRGFIESIPHKNKPKEWRIRNYVAEIMKMGRLLLNPHDIETKREMTMYKPGPKAKDNRLDVLAMAEVLIQKSCQPREDEKDYRKTAKSLNERHRADRRRRYAA